MILGWEHANARDVSTIFIANQSLTNASDFP